VESTRSYMTTANRLGAAFLGVRSAWASFVGTGMNHALSPESVLVAGRLDARCAAFKPVPAPTMQLVPLTAALPVVNHARKQTNVHKTRINAGGYGAMGPHPEREPA
jgi:hypothetical protein